MRLLLAAAVVAVIWPGAIVHAEPAGDTRSVAFGDLELTYDPALWSVARGDNHLKIECADRRCRSTPVYASIVDDPHHVGCTGEAIPARFAHSTFATEYPSEDTKVWSATHDGLTFYFAEIYIGCRNLAGGPVIACTHHDGATYFFEAPGDHCRTPWGIAAAIEGLLEGLKPK